MGRRADLPATDARSIATHAPTQRIPTKTVTLMYASTWTDPRSGMQRFGAKGWDAELPSEVADRVVANGVAVHEYDERGLKLRRERAGAPIADQDAISLDDPSVAPRPAPAERWISPHPTPRHSSIEYPASSPPAWMRPQVQPINGGDQF